MKKKEKQMIDDYIPAEIVSDDELDDSPVIEGVLISKPQNAPKGEKIIPTEGRILQALPVEEKGPLFYALPVEETPNYIPNEENPIPCNVVPIEKRQGSWTNYAGDWDGYYFDPQDDCYYEGKAPIEVQKMYLPPAEKIVKKVRAAGAPLTDKPKEKRAPLKASAGFDMADIYGQYVVEHNTNGEYFFTLYAKDKKALFESHNYASEQYCMDAIARFKKHVIAGTFEIVEKDGKFHYVLTRNINVYEGENYPTREDAEKAVKRTKNFAQTDELQKL